MSLCLTFVHPFIVMNLSVLFRTLTGHIFLISQILRLLCLNFIVSLLMRYTAVQEVYLTIGDLVLPKPLGLLNLVFLLYGRKITYTKKLRQPINGKLKSRYENIRLYDPLFSKQLSGTISQQLHDCGND